MIANDPAVSANPNTNLAGVGTSNRAERNNAQNQTSNGLKTMMYSGFNAANNSLPMSPSFSMNQSMCSHDNNDANHSGAVRSVRSRAHTARALPFCLKAI